MHLFATSRVGAPNGVLGTKMLARPIAPRTPRPGAPAEAHLQHGAQLAEYERRRQEHSTSRADARRASNAACMAALRQRRRADDMARREHDAGSALPPEAPPALTPLPLFSASSSPTFPPPSSSVASGAPAETPAMGAQLSQDTLAVSAVPAALARRPAVGSPSVPKRGRRRTGASPRADASPRAETDDDSGTDNDGDDDLAPRELFVRAGERHPHGAGAPRDGGRAVPHALVQAAVGGVGGGAAGSGGGARAPGGYDSNEDEDFDDNMMSLGEESDGAAGAAAVQPAAGAPAGGGVPPACALCTLPWELDEGDEALYDGAHFLRVEKKAHHRALPVAA